MHEAKSHLQNSFITLTYDGNHLPTDLSLNLSHWQNFAKKLRRECGPFRFMHCGEYGDENKRPHYHAVIFGMDFREDRKAHHAIRGNIYYTSEILSACWQKGFVLIGDLTFESAAYVARYTMKKQTGSRAEAHYAGRKPEYMTMSRRPGLGANWIKKWHKDVYPSDEVITRGKRSRPPKFYDNELEKYKPELIKKIKAKRKKKAEKQETTGEQTYWRLETKEKVLKDKIKKKTREI